MWGNEINGLGLGLGLGSGFVLPPLVIFISRPADNHDSQIVFSVTNALSEPSALPERRPGLINSIATVDEALFTT